MRKAEQLPHGPEPGPARKWVAAGIVACSWVLWAAGGFSAKDREAEQIERGRFSYEIYCINCHGKSGTGDGRTADILTVQPTDLTRLSQNNGGEFPGDAVRSAIDGRREVRGHGERRMPIWGLTFQELDRDTNQEAQVRIRIEQLVSYLQTIQVSEESGK